MTAGRQKFLVEGRVQGVGYRRWAASCALSLGLAGWVRNLPSGAVEVQARGNTQALKKLKSLLEKGPPASRVSRVTTLESPPGGEEKSFSIKYD